MKISRRKCFLGFFAVSFFVLVSSGFSGCGLIFPDISPPARPDTLYQWEETVSRHPSAVVSGNNIYVVEDEEKTVSINLKRQEKQRSLWQKFCGKLAGLGMAGAVGFAVFFVLTPSGAIMFLTKKYLEIKKALKQTVQGIDHSKRSDGLEPVLRNSLLSYQDEKTKRIVDSVKRG